jgi:hypothetical protein
MSLLREIAYRLDPVSWAREVLGIQPQPWQDQFLRAPRGASILALTARRCGKTTTAAWSMAHAAVFKPSSLSVVACPAHGRGEAVRRVRDAVTKAGLAIVGRATTSTRRREPPQRNPASSFSARLCGKYT